MPSKINIMIIKLITDFLAQVIDGFKQKNPAVYAVISILLLSIYYVLGLLLEYVNLDGTHLLSGNVENYVSVARNLLVGILTLIGAHTPRVVAEEIKITTHEVTTIK